MLTHFLGVLHLGVKAFKFLIILHHHALPVSSPLADLVRLLMVSIMKSDDLDDYKTTIMTRILSKMMTILKTLERIASFMHVVETLSSDTSSSSSISSVRLAN